MSSIPFILASASPRRKELIQAIIPNPIILPAEVDERITEIIPADEQPAHLALRKGKDVLQLHPEAIVLGCDTSVIIGSTILGKPQDQNEAFRMLRMLSGQRHTVITGCALLHQNQVHVFSEKTDVVFYELSDEEIERYIQTGEPMDKAGAYGIQGQGMLLVKEIHGDYTNVVGLPVPRLSRELASFMEKISS